MMSRWTKTTRVWQPEQGPALNFDFQAPFCKTIVYWGYIGIMDKKVETTIIIGYRLGTPNVNGAGFGDMLHSEVFACMPFTPSWLKHMSISRLPDALVYYIL